MLWEGLRIYSRPQYSAIPADSRFILTENVRDVLHPDIPERYVGRSILIIKNDAVEELEVEGINFLVVDDNSVPEFFIMSQREAERRYPLEMGEVRNSGSSSVVKQFQNEQEALIKIAGGKKSAVRKDSSAPRGVLTRKPAKKEEPSEEEEITITPVDKPVKAKTPAKKPAAKTSSTKTSTAKKTTKKEPVPVINIPDEDTDSETDSKSTKTTAKKPAAKSSTAKKTTTKKSSSKSSDKTNAAVAKFTKKAAVRTAKSVLRPLFKQRKK